MNDVELSSELMMFLLSGFSGKTQARINRAYKDYDDSVPHEAKVRRRLEHIFDVLDKVLLAGDDPDSQSKELKLPFLSQGWFYPLFALLHEFSYSGLVGPRKEPANPIDVVAIRRHLQGRARALQAEEADPDLLKALRGASTDTSSRQKRFDFLKKGWRGGR